MRATEETCRHVWGVRGIRLPEDDTRFDRFACSITYKLRKVTCIANIESLQSISKSFEPEIAAHHVVPQSVYSKLMIVPYSELSQRNVPRFSTIPETISSDYCWDDWSH